MPAPLSISAPAKLNLCLDILAKDPNGYHQIQSVIFRHDALSDELLFTETQESTHTSILNPDKNRPIHPTQNLAQRAALLLKHSFHVSKNVHIEIHKKIPSASGLGGASSDAASTLLALNRLWELTLTPAQLLALAATLGSDVPFFVLCHLQNTNLALATHYGETLEALPPLPPELEFTVCPQSSADGHKTQTAYSAVNLALCGQDTAKTQSLLDALAAKDLPQLLASLHNDFETLTTPPAGHHLSGAGPSTFYPT